ncbi:dTDP-4-dehydrorhamnose 3,5-epimerase [Candidatus Hydrogenedentota bacterium]
MKFLETELKGAYTIALEPIHDHRGSFARGFCAQEFREHGLCDSMVQSNLSVSTRKHTLRGMHYQVDGAEEAKLVRCFRGSILDVIIDLRKGSNTFGQHIGVELTESNGNMLYVPEGFAHGFISLEDDCHVFYQVSNFYAPGKEKGIRWNDPFFNIEWPTDKPVLSDKDANHSDFHVDT